MNVWHWSKVIRGGREIGFLRPYPQGVVDSRGRYIGPALECDELKAGVFVFGGKHGGKGQKSAGDSY